MNLAITLRIPLLAAAVLAARATTTFDNVPMSGGGYVTGLTPHPLSTSSVLLYLRTDTSGVFRWNPSSSSWTQLMAGQSSSTFYSCEGLSVDPSDSTLQNVYAFLGNNGVAHVFHSTDQGATWIDTDLPTSILGYGNGDYRWSGERLAMDPNQSGRILLGTRTKGLWYNNTVNGTPNSANWSQYTAVPVGTGTGATRDGNDKIGVTFVAYYAQGGTSSSGYTNIVYVGVSGQGVYKTTNAGTSWSAMSGSPSYPVHGAVDGSGNLYVTAANANAGSGSYGVFKHTSGGWSTITPSGSSGQQFSGLAINPNNSSDIIVAVGDADSGSKGIYYSSNGGSSWGSNLATGENNTVPWQPTTWFGSHMSYVVYTPTTANPNQAWFGDWYNVWNNPNITSGSPAWSNLVSGVEEGFAFTIHAPYAGTGSALLFTANSNTSGLRCTSLTSYPSVELATAPGGSFWWTSFDTTVSGSTDYVYAVGDSGSTDGGSMYQSTDNGQTWAQSIIPGSGNSLPADAEGGRIAVSASNASLVSWLPILSTTNSGNAVPYYSTDGGTSWNQSSGVTAENYGQFDDYSGVYLASNKGTTNCFYVYRPDIGFWNSKASGSLPAGASYSSAGSGLPSIASGAYATYGIKAVPGQDGAVWAYVALNTPSSGLFVSTNFGGTFSALNQPGTSNPWFTTVTQLGFGAPAPGSGEPAAVYVEGQQSGDTQDWLYESDDLGYSWTLLNGPKSGPSNAFGDKVQAVDGDKTVYGRPFIGTFGTGVWYGATNVLFADDFQTGSSSGWTVDAGTWGVNSLPAGAYAYGNTNGTGTAYSHAGQASWTDYLVQADVTPLTFNSGGVAILNARYTDTNDRYAVYLYGSGLLVLKKVVGGTQTTLASMSYSVSANTTYTVGLSAVGTTLQVFVDGTQEFSLTDSSLSSGEIAVGAYQGTAEFTNLLVTSQ